MTLHAPSITPVPPPRAGTADSRNLPRTLRRLWRRHGPVWLLGQALLTLGVAWLLWALAAPALGWAVHAARWQAVTGNLRLFTIGAYPNGPLGGLVLTAVLTLASVALAFPLGVVLALGRRSRLPLVKGGCVSYIELVRGAPLVTVLYMVALLVPLMVPGAARPGDLARAVCGLAAFTAAYIAEDVRGGLAAIGGGQFEAARALGLRSVTMLRLVILPQALRVVAPALVGQLISLFKNTALVSVVSALRELVGIARAVPNQPAYLGAYRETYVFVSVIFLALSYVFSRASRRLEKQR